MSDTRADQPNRLHPRDADEQLQGPSSSSSVQTAFGGQSDESAAAPADSAHTAAADQPADAQPLPEQTRKKQRRSILFCRSLDRLATIELQLCLQFLDKCSKLKAARCSRRLLQAADHPFAWKGPSVLVKAHNRPHLGSLIRQSLLRHASIALTLASGSELPVAELVVIPRLRELILSDRSSADFAVQLLALPALQGLQTLRAVCPPMPLSTMRLLPSLPALRTLECRVPDVLADCSWLPAMAALTDLDLTLIFPESPQPLFDTIGQCAQLRSLRLRHPPFLSGDVDFSRFCATPAMRQLRHFTLASFHVRGARLTAEEIRAAFSALAGLESLRFDEMHAVDLLLPHLAHPPALRTVTIRCVADFPAAVGVHGASHPSCEALRQLLIAAPWLDVQLEMASFDRWRHSFWYQQSAQLQDEAGAYCEQMDQQFYELQRVAAKLERVVIVHIDPVVAKN